MKKLIYIILMISSFSYSQTLFEHDQLRQQQINNFTGGTSIPVVESYRDSTSTTSPLTIRKPDGVNTDDLLVILLYNDNTSGADSWDNDTNKPTGFTLLTQTDSNFESDARFGIFYRVANGSESSTIDCPQVGGGDIVGYYIRISSASTTIPINVTGTILEQTGTSHVIPEVTTTQDNCLAIYTLAGDGGDMMPFSVAGTGWTQSAENRNSTGATVCSGTWGTKEMPTAGATGDATVTSNVSDGVGSVIFAINGN